MKNKKYHTIRIVLKSNRKIINTEAKLIPLSWLSAGTSIKSGRVKLSLWAQTSALSGTMWSLWAQTSALSGTMWSCKCFPHSTKTQTPSHNWMNSASIKNALILNFMHNIFNLRFRVVICLILVLLKRADDLNHHLNIRQYTKPS